LIDALSQDEEKIKDSDLRYIIIKGNQLYVFTSKKHETFYTSITGGRYDNGRHKKYNSMKVLTLSKKMKVETKYISKRHGHCVCIIDTKPESNSKALKSSSNASVSTSGSISTSGSLSTTGSISTCGSSASKSEKPKIVCTLLPVRLSSNYFIDDEYSQVIGSNEFNDIKHNLFGVNVDINFINNNNYNNDKNEYLDHDLNDNIYDGDDDASTIQRPKITGRHRRRRGRQMTDSVLRDISNDNEDHVKNNNTNVPEEEQQHVEEEEDEELNQCIDDDEDKRNSTLLSWPLSLPQIAPEQQNTTALCLQFALDSACHQYDKKM